MNTKDDLNHGFLKLRPVQPQKSILLGTMGGNVRLRLFILSGFFAFTIFTGLFFLAENRLFVAIEESTKAERLSVLAENLKLSMSNARSAEKSFLISEGLDFAKEFHSQLVSVGEALNNLSQISAVSSQQKNLDTIRDGLAQYDAQFSMLLSSQGTIGNKRLKRDLQLVSKKAQQFDDLLLYLTPSITSIVEFSKSFQDSRSKNLTSAQNLSRIVIFCSGTFLLSFITLIGFIVIRSFSNPMRELAATANRLAKENNLDKSPESANSDTTGEISRALEHWQESLTDLFLVRQELAEAQKLIQEVSPQQEVVKVTSDDLLQEALLPKDIKESITSEPTSDVSSQDRPTSLPDESISSASQQLANFSQYVNVSANDVERTGALIKGLDNTSLQMEKISAIVISIRDQTNLLTLRSVPKYSNSKNMGFHSDEDTKIAKSSNYNDGEISHCIDFIRDATLQAEEIAISISKNMAEVTYLARGIAITASEQALEATTRLLSQSEHLQNLLSDVISRVEPSSVISSKADEGEAEESIDSQQ